MSNLFIGLMSGTSADGIDAVLVDFELATPTLIQHYYLPFDAPLRNEILAIMQPGDNELERMGTLDQKIGSYFANAVQMLLEQTKLPRTAIRAIGSHGQTIRHYPYAKTPFTLQIGDPNIIAALTGITTIADFRRKDMALGGHGAPLVPRFHQAIFQTTHTRIIVNIGGIANITLLPATTSSPIIGFDTGPGNALLDAWSMLHLNMPHDAGGQWAATGSVNDILLTTLLKDSYFAIAPPKSTGRDYFQLTWLQKYLDQLEQTINPEDVQATLVELTARTILDGIKQQGTMTGEIVLCGGGVHNQYLRERLRANGAPHFTIVTSDALGVHPNLVEAMAFAWLAKQTLCQQPGNLPSVTGASQNAILGGVYY